MKSVKRSVWSSTMFVGSAALLFGPLACGSSAPATGSAQEGVSGAAPVTVEAQDAAPSSGFVVVEPEKHDVSPPFGDLVAGPVAPGRRTVPIFKPEHPERGVLPEVPDPVVQSTTIDPTVVGSTFGFDGVGDGFVGPDGTFVEQYSPPDTNGAAGTTQYVQWVNVDFAVFDKATGAVLAGPKHGSTIWAGFGGACESSDGGDPVVQFDKLNGRWVMMQMQFPGFASGSNGHYLCLAVSDGPDFLTARFQRYAFKFKVLTDYPKLGVWNDGYYVTFNAFKGFGTFAGPQVCAFNPALGATMQCGSLSAFYSSLLPADVDDATQPPVTGEPEYLVGLGTDSSSLLSWRLHIDWSNARRSTLTGPSRIAVDAFTRACGGGACIPQPGTSQQLDSLGDRLMYRLAYRNLGPYESLVTNHSVQAYSSGATGLRWYELRNTPSTAATAPSLYQRGTYAPDDLTYRWMGSVAMDRLGDLALGYSASGAGVHPDIRAASRCAGDATLGVLRNESELLPFANSSLGSQLGIDRWGDYSSMSPDPSDPQSLWFTTEYLASDGQNWRTRIVKLTLSCP